MLKHWWKILTVILLVYTVFVSLNTPLAPGIISVDKYRFSINDTLKTIATGYASSFQTEQSNLSAWLTLSKKPNQEAVCLSVEPTSDNQIKLFASQLPATWANESVDLYIKSDNMGSMALFSAFYLYAEPETELQQQDFSFCNPGSATTIPPYFNFSFKTILYETIRNLNFHVPMFFAMMFLMTVALVYGFKYLNSGNQLHDMMASQAINVALFFAFLGLVTGSIWARYTWGAWWVNDTKLNGTAISVLIYLAYLVLRNSVNDSEKRGRLAAVYSIFAYVLMMVFIMVLPRLTDSLHPGNGGNPAFSNYDLDNNLRKVFYPAVLAWILLAYWIFILTTRFNKIQNKLQNLEDEEFNN